MKTQSTPFLSPVIHTHAFHTYDDNLVQYITKILCLYLGGSISAESEDTFPGLVNNQVTHR